MTNDCRLRHLLNEKVVTLLFRMGACRLPELPQFEPEAVDREFNVVMDVILNLGDQFRVSFLDRTGAFRRNLGLWCLRLSDRVASGVPRARALNLHKELIGCDFTF
jgi:hypothetical protein